MLDGFMLPNLPMRHPLCSSSRLLGYIPIYAFVPDIMPVPAIVPVKAAVSYRHNTGTTTVQENMTHNSVAFNTILIFHTDQVMSGGASGMGACLHEVETLAFLKLKRQEAGLTHERSRFAELASWFYKRSAVGGVDHVCLVFSGGGLSLREAMSARSPPKLGVGVAALGSAGRQGASPPLLAWEAREVVEVARGLLEVRARRSRCM